MTIKRKTSPAKIYSCTDSQIHSQSIFGTIEQANFRLSKLKKGGCYRFFNDFIKTG
jgi:hypothetical protein